MQVKAIQGIDYYNGGSHDGILDNRHDRLNFSMESESIYFEAFKQRIIQVRYNIQPFIIAGRPPSFQKLQLYLIYKVWRLIHP